MTINLGQNQTITLTFYDPQNQLINSTDLPIQIQTIQMPGYMTYTKFTDDPDHAPLKIYENTETNEEGKMNLKYL